MDILEILHQELKQAAPIRNISVVYEDTLASDPELLADSDNMDRAYWVNWSEQMGAWVSPDGMNIQVCVVNSAKEIDPGILTLGFTSLLTGVCLNLKGQVAIHANAVILNNQASAFIGYSGVGKSTLSAYCANRGAGFLTDDVLVVNDQGYVLPGNPRVKLFQETGNFLGLDTSEQTNYKLFYHPETHLGGTYQPDSVPLGNMYLLVQAEKDEIYIESVPPAQGVFDLLTHAYDVNRFIDRTPRLLDAYVQLLDKIPLKRLVYPRDFNRLPEVYALLLKESER
jgi:hypothetical protein